MKTTNADANNQFVASFIRKNKVIKNTKTKKLKKMIKYIPVIIFNILKGLKDSKK